MKLAIGLTMTLLAASVPASAQLGGARAPQPPLATTPANCVAAYKSIASIKSGAAKAPNEKIGALARATPGLLTIDWDGRVKELEARATGGVILRSAWQQTWQSLSTGVDVDAMMKEDSSSRKVIDLATRCDRDHKFTPVLGTP